MHIEIVGPTPTSLKNLITIHNGESIQWDVSHYDKSTFKNLPGLFKEINAFWARCSEEVQNKIWNCYKEIKEDLDLIEEPRKLQAELRDKVTKLYSLMKFDDIKRWSLLYGEIRLPANIKKDYGENDPIDRTYLRDDYYDLVIFSVALKPMVPIFGEYIPRVKNEYGTTHKEKMALNLLSRSKLVTSPAWERLNRYIEASVENEKLADSAILGGLGTAELPGWLLSKAVVRRVVIGEIGVVDDNTSLISNVYHAMTASLRYMDRNFNGRVNEKMRPRDGADEDNMSHAETYKVKQEISDGDLAILSVYTEDIEDMAQRVDPTVETARLHRCVQDAFANQHLRISQHHLTLCQWVLADAMPTRGIPSLSKPALLRAIATTQSLLWHWGFPDLAGLMLSEEIVVTNANMVPAMESPSRIPKELVDRLVEIYPHYQRMGGKAQRDRQVNVGCKAVEALSREITKSDWKYLGSGDLVKVSNAISTDKTLIVPTDIRGQLASLIIHLAS